MKRILLSLSVIFAITIVADAAPLTIELPNETAVFRQAPGADLANAQCLTCHSAEYVSTQPPMPRAFWKGSVDKMIGKYGAPVPADQIEALADYLSQNYGRDATNTASAPLSAKEVHLPKIMDAKQLMQKTGCFNCHGVDRKIIGPAFREIAGKYRGNAEASANVTRQITQGGAGLWGPIPMPPFKQFSEAEIKVLADWILVQK